MPADAGHREKWRLALDMIDELAGWGMRPPLVVADAGYGDCSEFRLRADRPRHPLRRQVMARADRATPLDAQRTAAAYRGRGRPPVAAYRQPPVSVKDLIAAPGAAAARTSDLAGRLPPPRRTPGRMRSQFVFTRVRPAGKTIRTAHPGQDLPETWLIAEWPPEPRTRPVLAVQPARHHPETPTGPTGQTTLAHRARLPRTQNRPRPGPLRRPHLARLAPPRHPRLRRPRLLHPATPRPKSPCAGMTLYARTPTHANPARPPHRTLPHLHNLLPATKPRPG